SDVVQDPVTLTVETGIFRIVSHELEVEVRKRDEAPLSTLVVDEERADLDPGPFPGRAIGCDHEGVLTVQSRFELSERLGGEDVSATEQDEIVVPVPHQLGRMRDGSHREG